MIIDRMSCMCGGMLISVDWDDWKCDRCGETREFACVYCDCDDLQDFWEEGEHFGSCMGCGNYWNLVELETKD